MGYISILCYLNKGIEHPQIFIFEEVPGAITFYFPLRFFQIIQSTEEFEKALKEMRFLKGDTTDLLKYARNINSHFANKKCQDVIVAARNLMTSEIHNTVKVSVISLHCI